MTPTTHRYLIWHEDRRADVPTLAELDRLLDQLEDEAASGMPFTVELHADEHTELLALLGRDESYLAFHSTAYTPWIWVCVGPWDDDAPIEFTYRGHWSAIVRRYTVPIEDARTALRQFFQSAERPDNVRWVSA